MTRLFDKLFGSTVDAPVCMVLVIVLLTSLSVLGQTNPDLLRNLFTQQKAEEAVPGNSSLSRVRDAQEEKKPVPNIEAVSLTDSDLILVVESSKLFTPEGARALREIVSTLEKLETVREVFWMDSVPVLNIFGLRESLFPSPRASQRQFDVARAKAIEHPLVGGQLLSPDGETLLLLIKLDWLFVTSDEDCTTGIRETAEAVAARHPDVPMQFLVTGRVPIYLTFVKSQLMNRWMYQMIGYGMVTLMAMVLFRGIRAVMIVAIAASLGVFWTIGMLHYFDLQDNPFNDIVLPVLLSLIGLTDGVHLLVEIRRQRGSGLSEREAARNGIVNVGLACALTSLTTAIGFGSLALAHHDIVREFGWSCVLGVFLTFIAVITTIPLACSTRLGRNLHVGQERGLIDRNLTTFSRMIDFVMRHSRKISTTAIVSTILLTAISLTLRPDEKRSNALPTGSEASRAIEHMDRAFGGMEHSSVRIEWTPEVDSDSPEILEVIGQVDQVLKAQPLIGSPLSLKSFIDALPGEGSAADRMPLAELLPPPLKRAFYHPERRTAEIDFRVQDLGIAKYGPVFTEVEERLAQIVKEHPEFTLSLRGSAASRWKDLYQIVVDLALSLGSAMLIIFFVLALAYRSLRLGLISLIPNIFPLAVTGTYLVMMGQSLELASVCAFTVCLGIAVDDTIHFLTRFEEERKALPIGEAIRRAFTRTGTALIMTTVILVIGFVTVLFSDMRDQRIFAIMGILTIGSALFADLVFLPALLSTFLPQSWNSSNSSLKLNTSETDESFPVQESMTT